MYKLTILSVLLLTSCASNNLKTWHKTYEYTEVGVRCKQEYYYSFKYGKCVYLPEAKPAEAQNPVILPEKAIKHTKARVAIKAPRIDCKKLFTDINKCSI